MYKINKQFVHVRITQKNILFKKKIDYLIYLTPLLIIFNKDYRIASRYLKIYLLQILEKLIIKYSKQNLIFFLRIL